MPWAVQIELLTIFGGHWARATRDEDNNSPALRSEHPLGSSFFEVFSALWSNCRRATNPLK